MEGHVEFPIRITIKNNFWRGHQDNILSLLPKQFFGECHSYNEGCKVTTGIATMTDTRQQQPYNNDRCKVTTDLTTDAKPSY